MLWTICLEHGGDNPYLISTLHGVLQPLSIITAGSDDKLVERAPKEAGSQDISAPGHLSGGDFCGKLGNEPSYFKQ